MDCSSRGDKRVQRQLGAVNIFSLQHTLDAITGAQEWKLTEEVWQCGALLHAIACMLCTLTDVRSAFVKLQEPYWYVPPCQQDTAAQPASKHLLASAARCSSSSLHVSRVKERMGVALDGQLAATFMKCFSYAGDLARVRAIHVLHIKEMKTPPNAWHYNAAMFSYARVGDWASVLNFYKCAPLCCHDAERCQPSPRMLVALEQTRMRAIVEA
jgi:hypothetical protein